MISVDLFAGCGSARKLGMEFVAAFLTRYGEPFEWKR